MSNMEVEEDGVSPGDEASKNTQYNIHRKIFVGNVSYRIKSRKLSRFFSKFGAVEYCYIVKDHLKGWSRGIAFVTFKEVDSVKKALEADEMDLYLDTRQMRVKPAELSTKTTYWQNDAAGADDDSSDDDDGVYISESSHVTMETPQSDETKNTEHGTEIYQIQDGSCPIDSLFEELLIQIFTYLSWRERIGVERVCWRWKHVVQQSWATQKHLHFQKIFKGFDGLTDKKLNCVLSRCGSYLESLDLSASPRMVTDFTMDIIGKHSPQLKEVDLTAVKITNISMKNLTSRCKNLQKVRLKKCLHVGDKGVAFLLDVCKDLVQLDLSEIPLFTGQCFRSITEPLHSLRIVILNNCHMLKDTSMEHLVQFCPNIEELYITNGHKLSSQTLIAVCQYCTNLRCLHVPGTNFDTNSLEKLQHLKNLESLNVSFRQKVKDSTLRALGDNCLNLRHIDISGCNSVTDIGILALTRLPCLTSVNIGYLSQVNTDSIIKLAQCGRLHRFVARATKFTTDKVVISLATQCPHLEHIDVSGCFEVTSRIFEGFRNASCLNNNTRVDLILGGTSVDWASEEIDWLADVPPHLNVSMHNPSLLELRPDRDIILPSYDDEDNWSDSDEHPAHPPLSAFIPDHVEDCVDWEEDYYDDDMDGFLDNDDPLEAERWNMS